MLQEEHCQKRCISSFAVLFVLVFARKKGFAALAYYPGSVRILLSIVPKLVLGFFMITKLVPSCPRESWEAVAGDGRKKIKFGVDLIWRFKTKIANFA